MNEVRRTYFVLLALRWFSTGLIIPAMALLPLDRGLTIAQMGAAFAMQGFVTLVLELPTGGLADTWGRKPVLVLSGCVCLIALWVLLFARSPLAFGAAAALMGVYRALDSGPLDSWFVDEAHRHDIDADITKGLAGGGSVIGLAIGAGALTAGGLIAWQPLSGVEALAVPVVASIVAQSLAVVSVFVLMKEERRPTHSGLASSLREVPRAVLESIALLRASRALKALIAISALWGFGMVAFETIMPIRLAELLDDRSLAGAVMGPVAATGWIAFAAGSALAPWIARRLGILRTASGLRIAQGLGVMTMGLVTGPSGLVFAYFVTYAIHGAAGPLHSSLLHARVTSAHRSTVVSLSSLAAQPGGSIGLIVLGAIATEMSTATSLFCGAAVLALAAPLYFIGTRERAGAAPGRTDQ